MSRTLSVHCPVEIALTPETFHAYAVPDGVALRPGDAVQVHDVPTEIAFGEVIRRDCRATVRRAGLLKRAWTRATSVFLLTSLYEVGFEPKPTYPVSGTSSA
ncbi:hypothetical protein NFI95_03385 [Acetobacteraceae bacterium KSS8]|uniref:Primosomal protein N' 3' DNA-binding domain-containing protein n=1 Tax=Endosaccharibacter trunci TaxID=2812733 RepID=A0ABT1W3Q2_9PROT|nr:hypothetical protein [Acetobacteraceae bacterium KSS8]